jgi:hypothetical protein
VLLERCSPDHVAEAVRSGLEQARGRWAAKPRATAGAGVDPLREAERYVFEGPANPWHAPSRFGRAGNLARRALLRLLRPYTTRHHEFDVALVEALREQRVWRETLESTSRDAAAETSRLRLEHARGQRRLNRIERALTRATPPSDLPPSTEDPRELPDSLVRLHRVLDLFGMTTPTERAYCHWYARERYTGRGEVVELGSWLGSLTASLAIGLGENPRDAVQSQRVQAFDRFVWEPWMDEHEHVVGTEVEGLYEPGESFRAEFEAQVAPWRARVDVHEGNIVQLGRHGGEIEFLLVDAMKSWETARAILKNFLSRLLPQVGLIMHQDFSHYFTYWIHLLMHRLQEYFELAYDVPDSSSAVFRLKRALPEALLVENYSLASFSAAEIEAAFQHSLALVDPAKAPNIVAGKLFALIEKGELDRADRELRRWSGLARSPKSELARVSGLLAERLAGREPARDRGAA